MGNFISRCSGFSIRSVGAQLSLGRSNYVLLHAEEARALGGKNFVSNKGSGDDWSHCSKFFVPTSFAKPREKEDGRRKERVPSSLSLSSSGRLGCKTRLLGCEIQPLRRHGSSAPCSRRGPKYRLGKTGERKKESTRILLGKLGWVK